MEKFNETEVTLEEKLDELVEEMDLEEIDAFACVNNYQSLSMNLHLYMQRVRLRQI